MLGDTTSRERGAQQRGHEGDPGVVGLEHDLAAARALEGEDPPQHADHEAHARDRVVVQEDGLQQRWLVDALAIAIQSPRRFAEDFHGVGTRHAHRQVTAL